MVLDAPMRPSAGAEPSDCPVIHIGALVENVAILHEAIQSLPQSVIHVYTASKASTEALKDLPLPGKQIIPHLLEGVYPEQWLFTLSRKIAEKRIQETITYIPDILALKAIPDHTSLVKLAIRRLSLSRVYMELSLLYAILQIHTPSTKEPLLIFTHHLHATDLPELNKLKDYQPFIQIVPIPLNIKVKKNLFANWKKQATLQLETLNKKTPQHFLISAFLKLDQNYQTKRDSLFYTSLRQIEVSLRKTRFFIKHALKMLQFQLFRLIQQIKLKILKNSTQNTLFVTAGLTEHNLKYISRIQGPIVDKLQQANQSITFLNNTRDAKLCKALTSKLAPEEKNSRAIKSIAIHLPYFDSRLLFQSSVRTLKRADFPEVYPEDQYALIANTTNSIYRLKYLMSLLYTYAKELQFSTAIGMEEDIEMLSMLNILKPRFKQPFTTFIVPSCLPEYSQCYDCADVDHLAVSMDFVREIFEDQQVGAKQVHVLGSLEWEEPSDLTGSLSREAEQLIQASSFTLGVLHQPIFVTMHQNPIYNGLIMNFLKIYEQFLENHPTACILIKPHPRDNLEDLKAYLGDLPRIVILPKETSNPLFYTKIDAAISMHSTMVTHAMAHGVPVVSMYQYPDYKRMYDYIRKAGCLATDSVPEALSWLEQMQNNPQFRADITQKMAALKESCLSVPTSEKIIFLLQESSEDAPKALT